jgi:hypothetical protein
MNADDRSETLDELHNSVGVAEFTAFRSEIGYTANTLPKVLHQRVRFQCWLTTRSPHLCPTAIHCRIIGETSVDCSKRSIHTTTQV